jgi:rubredoxin
MKTTGGGIISKRIRCVCGHHLDVFCSDEISMVETLVQVGWEKLDGKWVCRGCTQKKK